MAVGEAYVFPGFLTPVLTQLFFPKPPTTFLTCFCRGERWRYTGKKVRLNRGSNTQPPGHESDTLTTEPAERRIFPLSKGRLLSLFRGGTFTKKSGQIKSAQSTPANIFRAMNPVTMTIINPRNEHWPSRRFGPATSCPRAFHATSRTEGLGI